MKLTVPSPCSQSWQLMSPDGENRFCTACQKSVIDFTTKSDKEIIDYLKNNTGKICGSFHPSQLNKELVYSYKSPFRFNRAAGAFLSAITFAGIANAQSTHKKDEMGAEKSQAEKKETAPSTTHSDRINIKGQVKDSRTAEPLPFVNIQVVGTNMGCASDFDGNFQLGPLDTKLSSLTLKISYVGYENQEVVVDLKNKAGQNIHLNVVLIEPAIRCSGEMVIVQQKKNFFKRVFGKKKKVSHHE